MARYSAWLRYCAYLGSVFKCYRARTNGSIAASWYRMSSHNFGVLCLRCSVSLINCFFVNYPKSGSLVRDRGSYRISNVELRFLRADRGRLRSVASWPIMHGKSTEDEKRCSYVETPPSPAGRIADHLIFPPFCRSFATNTDFIAGRVDTARQLRSECRSLPPMLVGISRPIELMISISKGLATWNCAVAATKPIPWNVD